MRENHHGGRVNQEVPIKLYLQNQVPCQIWPGSYSLLTPGLGEKNLFTNKERAQKTLCLGLGSDSGREEASPENS